MSKTKSRAGKPASREASCATRWQKHKTGRISDLRKLWNLYMKDTEASDPDLGTLNEYGLSLDYVAPETFKDQPEGYLRYQISFGGPSDEFRFYMNPDFTCHRIEYWFLDWFDGHGRELHDSDESLMMEIFEDWRSCETPEHLYHKAMEGI